MCWHPPQPTRIGSYSGGSCCSRSPSAAAAAFPASRLVAQILFPCAAAQHDAAPPQQNTEIQAHAHSHSEHSDTPRPQAQRPASYYSCSEGGVIKHERANSSRTCSNRALSHSFLCSRQKKNSRHVGVRQQWSAVLSHCTACAECWQVSVSFCLLSKRVSFGWLARDCVFILAGRRVPLFAC